jgi:hypothetical protein
MTLCLTFLCAALWGQTKISGVVEWDRGVINTEISLNMHTMGLRLPFGRLQGEEILSEEYPRLIRPLLLSLPADSSSTVEDMINRGEFGIHDLDALSLEAKRVAPSLSTDLSSLKGRYSIELTIISSALARHDQPALIQRPLIPQPAAPYTGIIIIADEELPVHGRNSAASALPCLFPKIWDTEMNLIYEKNTIEQRRLRDTPLVRYTSAAGIFRPTPSGLDEELTELVGSNPLRILARELFGIWPTDPVIDREDALKILSSQNNQKLLREGRVIIVISEKALKTPFSAE